MSHPLTTRKRGGQPGNQNNLKHGLYSKYISVHDDEPTERPARIGHSDDMSRRSKHGLYSQHISIQDDELATVMPLDLNNDELALARIRLKYCILRQASAPPDQWLNYEKAIALYLSRIVAMVHHNAVLGQDKKAAFITVLEMIRQVNEEQHVK